MTRPRLLCRSAVVVLLLSMAHAHLSAESRAKAPDSAATPILVELFTSEGCSDCPPADDLLARLDRSQPVAGAQLIVLSEHVDYWNDIGWKDPYSSHAYSERQSAYARRFGLDGVYTPQMVVDGKFQFVGSDERRAVTAAEKAAKELKIRMSLSGAHLESETALSVHLDAGQLPSIAKRPASVLVVIADERDESHVIGGENGGRTLRHVAVLRRIKQVGSLDRANGLSEDVSIEIPRRDERMRLIAFAQDEEDGTIWGVASTRFSK